VEGIEELSDVIKHLTLGQFVELIEDIYITIFTLDAWRGALYADIKFRTMCYML
jgi:hypothetical protein